MTNASTSVTNASPGGSPSHERVALVTGSTSGIGVVIAQQLARDGFRVLVSGRNAERGRAVVDSIGGSAQFLRSDATEPDAAQHLVAQAIDAAGHIDVLVNNAAIDHTNDLLEVTDREIRDTFETNTFAPMNLLIQTARHLRDRVQRGEAEGGAIINITSRLAHIGVPTMGIYSASKGAIEAFVRAAAIDLAPFNIRVNSVAPGMTRTPLYEEWLAGLPDPDGEARRVAEAIPLGRIAEPADVAAAVSFLASPGAAYITGAMVPVEGGYLAK